MPHTTLSPRDELPLLIADLFEASGAMRRHGDQLAAVAGQTQARWQVLSVISEGQWTVPRVARRLGISRQAVQRVADALAAEDLLRAEPNPDHQRSVLLRPTAGGHRVLAEITAAARPWNARAASGLSADEIAVTRRVLRALVDATP
jgi:DNA-binding MarR family transcriptional regulator